MENKISDGIYWIGVHFPDPSPGVSVNSFLVLDEKNMIIDCGPPATAHHLIANIKEMMNPKDIDYILITHADVDHIGGLPALLEEAPQAVILASPYESRGLGYWGIQPEVQTIEDGDTLSLGQNFLRFIHVPYSCMPGTMVAFEETKGILFSADLYAALGPSEWKIFSDTDQSEMLKGVQQIKLGNTQHTRTSLEKVASLPVKIIASSHGAMINSNIREYTEMLLAETRPVGALV